MLLIWTTCVQICYWLKNLYKVIEAKAFQKTSTYDGKNGMKKSMNKWYIND